MIIINIKSIKIKKVPLLTVLIISGLLVYSYRFVTVNNTIKTSFIDAGTSEYEFAIK